MELIMWPTYEHIAYQNLTEVEYNYVMIQIQQCIWDSDKNRFGDIFQDGVSIVHDKTPFKVRQW